LNAPGQKARKDFPRFGLPQYANRFPSNITDFTIEVELDGESLTKIDLSSDVFSRCTIKTDFHCVTTWSYLGVEWSGVKFLDLFEYIKKNSETKHYAGAVFHAQDGYKTSMILEDALAEDVIIADTMDGEPLTIEHGAPIRLVAPSHYGYKNLKHLDRIEFYSNMPVIKRGLRAFLDHPRARINHEERGRWVPGWILRYVYRLMITGTAKDFKDAMKQYKAQGK